MNDDKQLIERLKELLQSRPNFMTLSVADGARLLALAEQGERLRALLYNADVFFDHTPTCDLRRMYPVSEPTECTCGLDEFRPMVSAALESEEGRDG